MFSDINIVFARRQELFRQVYLHKTCQAIELMVAEALIKANPVYRFDEAIFEPKRYISLVRDDLLSIIKRSNKPQLKESASLLKRIDQRDIYKLVGEAIIMKELRTQIRALDI